MRNKQASFVALLEHWAEARGEQTAFIYLHNGCEESDRVTFAQLRERAASTAWRIAQVASPGERVILCCDSTLDFVVGFFGALYSQTVPVPIPVPRKFQKLDRLRSVVRSASPRATIVGRAGAEVLREVLGSDAGLVLPPVEVATQPEANHLDAPSPGSSTLAFLQFTSGSTGDAKGVCVSHGNLLCNSEIIAQAFDHDESTVCGGWLPPFHDMGLIGVLLQSIYLGRPCIVMPPVAFLQHPLRWLEVISRYRVTTTGGPNFGYDLCLRKAVGEDLSHLDLSSWNVAFNGAEPVKAETVRRFSQQFSECGLREGTMFPCYGLAEGTLMLTGGYAQRRAPIARVSRSALRRDVIAASTDEEDLKEVVSCGVPRVGTELVIVSPEGEAVPERVVGEIWARGPTVALGYYESDLATDEKFRASLTDGRGGFLRTGDLGYLHHGELYITGRIKDLIIVRGENYYPQDIEHCAAEHPALDGVAGAAFAVSDGENERLVLVHEVNFAHRNIFDAELVSSAVRTQVAREYGIVVADIVFVRRRTIPQTSSGKIMRTKCKVQYLEGDLRVAQSTKGKVGDNVTERAF